MSPDGSPGVSPEEKLLRLIRGKPQAPSSPPRSPAALPLTGTIRAPTGRGWRLPSWWVSGLNVLLGSVVLGELIALLVVVMQPAPLAGPVEFLPPSSDPEAQPPTTQQDLTSTLATAVSRPLFHNREHAGAVSPSSAIPSAGASALASRLSLLGIVAGEKPQAIVEDTQTKKTYFVTVGQHVIEGLVVEAVQENRVVLTLNGERVELSL